MKNIFTLVFMFASLFAFSQDFEGVIEREITYEDVSVELKAYISTFPASVTTYSKGNLSKTVTPNAMGGETVVLSDQESGEMITLMNTMGNKIAIRSNMNEAEEEEDPEVEYIDETKEILGYECKKAFVETEEGEVTIFYTEKLPNLMSSKQAAKIKGFPMQMIVSNDQITSITTVTKINEEKVKKIKMEIPSDFEEMSLEELQEKMGGM